MDTAALVEALVAVIRIASIALLCWGGWLCISNELLPRRKRGAQEGSQNARSSPIWKTGV